MNLLCPIIAIFAVKINRYSDMSTGTKNIFQRAELLLGGDALQALSGAKVIIFGVGGVGSWCAEGLVRSGVGHLTIVDPDRVAVSNVNRQLMATTATVGEPKVRALRERLLLINPAAEISAVEKAYSAETAAEFSFGEYDYIIDAIDTLKDKARLILDAASSDSVFFSSMGAALKVDPTRVRVADFWKVRDCPLGAALRKKLRQAKTIPARSFLCVYGDEVLENRGFGPETATLLGEEAAASGKAVINGSLAHITAIFGMTLAGLVIKDACSRL